MSSLSRVSTRLLFLENLSFEAPQKQKEPHDPMRPVRFVCLHPYYLLFLFLKGQEATSLSVMAVKKNANARTAAQTPTIWNRSAWLTSAFQFFGGAPGCQVSVALLIGTVPMTLIKIQMSTASTPAHRSQNPGALPSRIVTAMPVTAVGIKKAGTSTRSLSTSA